MQAEILHPASLQLVRTLLQQLYGAQKVTLVSAKPIDISDATDGPTNTTGPSAVVIVTIILILLTLILLMLAVIAITIRLYQHGMVFYSICSVFYDVFLFIITGYIPWTLKYNGSK